MLIRIFHARVRPGKQADFKKVLELLTLPAARASSGMVAFYPGQPLGPDSNDFVLVTVWKERKGLVGRSLEEWERAIIPTEALPLVEDWHIEGYKAFGVLEQSLQPLFQNI